MKKTNSKWMVLAVFIGCVWCGNAGAELIYKADFSSYSEGNNITTNATGSNDTASSLTAGATLTGSFKAFNGSANGMTDGLSLKMTPATWSSNGSLTFYQTKLGSYADGKTLIVSFDAYADGTTTTGGDIRAGFLKPNGSTNGTTVVAGTGLLKQKVRFTMVMNQSGLGIALPDGSTLNDNGVSIYAKIDGSSTYTILSNEAIVEGTEAGGFRVSSLMRSADGYMLMDNLGVWTSASDAVGGQSVLGLEFGTAIPEPATVGLFTISGLSVLLVRRALTR